MINQVVVAGSLTTEPTPGSSAGEPWLDLTLEIEHLDLGGPPETCVVRARVDDPRQIAIAQQYLTASKAIVVEGHLRFDDSEELIVSARRWHFLPDNLDGRCLFDPDMFDAEELARTVEPEPVNHYVAARTALAAAHPGVMF